MKRAMVTGASSGIGAAVVRQLLADSWQVIGMSRSLPPFSQPNFRHLMVDVSQRSALLAALEQIEPPQAIIHAAGSMAAAPWVIWTLSAASRCGVYMSMLLRHWSITSPRPWGQAGGSFCWEAVRHEAPLVARSMRPPKPRWSLSPGAGRRAGACRGDGQRRGSRGNRYADASSARQRKFPAAASAAWATHYSAGSGLSGELVAERGRIGDDRTGAGDVWRRIAGLMLCRTRGAEVDYRSPGRRGGDD